MPPSDTNAQLFTAAPAPVACRSGRLRLAGLSALLLLACLLLNGHFLWNPPVFDDVRELFGGSLLEYTYHFQPWRLRWLPYASFGWTQRLLGLDLIWYHLGNVLLHAANVVLLMLLLRRLCRQVLGQPSSRNLSYTACAFAGALLFALHPTAVYAVAYLNQRSTLMALLFSLLALRCVVTAAESGKTRHYWLWVFWYAAAVFTKEHAIMLPAVALALVVLLQKPSRSVLRALFLPALATILLGAFVIWNVKASGILATAYQSDGPALVARNLGAGGSHPWPLSIITQATLFFKYWLLWLLPNPAWMSVDMFEPFAGGLLAWPQLPGFLLFLAYGAAATWLLLQRGRRGLFGFALLTPWLLFATEVSTVRIQEPFVLYRSYLWMALPVGCLPLLLLPIGRRRALVYLGAICLFLVPLSTNRLQSFSHPLLLWDDAVRLAERQPVLPGTERLYYNRGKELARLKQYALAIKDYTHAIQIYPQDSYAYLNRGVVFHMLGQEQRALADFDASLAHNRADARAWWNRGLSLAALGQPAQAHDSYVQACRRGLTRACAK